MLFNSYHFIFIFLPITWAAFYLLGKSRPMLAAAWLACASLFFYGYWDPHYLPLLLTSISVNYLIGKKIFDHIELGQQASAKRWLQAGLIFDLGLLGYYKYTGFILGSWVNLTGADFSVPNIILPLGISFFTFTQIAYLVDAYRGVVKERNPVHYLLFISYFPHLIAGPVLHHRQVMPQFNQVQTYRISHENIAIGFTIFTIGLIKKILLADSLAIYSTPVFELSTEANTISTQDAWIGASAYTLQLYFDFSGYSDMAIGLSRLFGIHIPINFDSPHKATNIIDFWRRWHITLSQFLRNYLYFALGGNKKGVLYRYRNIFLTMLLGGIWHGAGWTFVVWGSLHGIFLIVNHVYRDCLLKYLGRLPRPSWWYTLTCWALTMLCVCVGLVIFRSSSLSSAAVILEALFNPFNTQTYHHINQTSHAWQMIFFSLAIAALAPNTQQIMGRYMPSDYYTITESNHWWQWRPSKLAAIITAISFTYCVANINKVSEFLYFQF